MIPPLLALLAWVPVSLYFFRRYPVRVALLLTFIGGWAVLPSAQYVPSSSEFAYWFLPVSLPTNYYVTKAVVPSIAALLGLWLAGKPFRFNFSIWDLPIAVWCIVPILSGIANPGAIGQALHGGIYQTMAWGVPYFLGRLYFSDIDSLLLAAKAFVVGGLVYVPMCLFEIVTGPQLYAHLYGYEPLRWRGAIRYIGYRPIGFLESGNQLGIWMAASALVATWLWRHFPAERVAGVRIGFAAAALFVVTLLCQSGGSILLLGIFLPFIFVNQRSAFRMVTLLLVLGIVTFAGFRLSNRVSLRAIVEQSRSAHATADFLKKIRRGSLGWRLEQDERNVGIALRNPILGSGEWDWWRNGMGRPWGLWLLSFGMYGLVGLVALQSMQLIPVLRAAWFPLARGDLEASHLPYALSAAILMLAIDNLLNSSMILPWLLVLGGLTTARPASSMMVVEAEEPVDASV